MAVQISAREHLPQVAGDSPSPPPGLSFHGPPNDQAIYAVYWRFDGVGGLFAGFPSDKRLGSGASSRLFLDFFWFLEPDESWVAVLAPGH